MGNVGQTIKCPKSCTRDIEFYHVTIGQPLEDQYKMTYLREWKDNDPHDDQVGLEYGGGVINKPTSWIW